MSEITSGKRPVLTSFFTYTGRALITVLSAWIIDAAHNSNDDQPEQVNACIESFME